jgi:acetyl-CoA C-acetyltransferase
VCAEGERSSRCRRRLSSLRQRLPRSSSAAQVLADIKEMGLGEQDYTRINVNESGISLGHPIACTGTHVLVTLLHEMKRRGARFGLETICDGGGLGIAAVFEKT